MAVARDIYCSEAHTTFCNKCDWEGMSHVVHALSDALHESRQNLTVFVAGTHDGKDVEGLVTQTWWRPSEARVLGWEVQRWVRHNTAVRLRRHKEVTVYHAGVSNVRSRLAYYGVREIAGLWNCWGDFGCGKAKAGEVDVIRWADVVEEHGFSHVSYVWLDVEGHEVNALQGMELERLSGRFPIIQYELGKTWGDSRHTSNWTQYDTARFLEANGYTIYMMGSRHANNTLTNVERRRARSARRPTTATDAVLLGDPVLLKVASSFFRDTHLVGVCHSHARYSG